MKIPGLEAHNLKSECDPGLSVLSIASYDLLVQMSVIFPKTDDVSLGVPGYCGGGGKLLRLVCDVSWLEWEMVPLPAILLTPG